MIISTQITIWLYKIFSKSGLENDFGVDLNIGFVGDSSISFT